MLQVEYYIKGRFYKSRPFTKNKFLTIIHIIPDQEKVIDHLNTIPFLNQIINDVQNKKTLLILYAGDEGYFFSSIDFLNIIDTSMEVLNNWSIQNNFDKNYVFFLNHNLKSNEICENLNYNFKCFGHPYESEKYLFLDNVSNFQEIDYRNKKINKHFLTYNRNMRVQREYFMLKVIESNLLDFMIYSFKGSSPILDFDNKLRETININEQIIIDYKNLPKKIIGKKVNDTFGDWQGQQLMINHYSSTFLSIVSETEVGDNTVYLSEKTFKPIVALHPFISISSKDTLKYIKNLGYKTFDKWWDETYDEASNFIERIDKIILIIKKLSKKSKSELEKMKLEMFDVLLHNRNTYINRIKTNHYIETLNYIEKMK